MTMIRSLLLSGLILIPSAAQADSVAGQYLVSRQAQFDRAWDLSLRSLENIMAERRDPVLIQRGMILAMSIGNYDKAMSYAGETLKGDPANELALIIKTLGLIKSKNYEAVDDILEQLSMDSIGGYVSPILVGWVSAARGEFYFDSLPVHAMHRLHGAMMADYLGKTSKADMYFDRVMKDNETGTMGLELTADYFARRGQDQKAIDLYNRILVLDPNHVRAHEKSLAVQKGKSPSMSVYEDNVDAGVALALQTLAQALFKDTGYNNDSALLFAAMAHYMTPDMEEAVLILSDVLALENSRIQRERAIGLYQSIGQDSPYYIQAQLRAVSLIETVRSTQEARAYLHALSQSHDTIEVDIALGDLYRREENYMEALEWYNKASDKLSGPIPESYWHLLYTRGIAYEQLDQWDKAERDLKAALAYRPDNPYILNYLGYSWADKAENLDKAYALLEEAVMLKPQDGYIADSLGWVLYRMGQYEEAAMFLEKAASLSPYDAVINNHLGDAYQALGRDILAKYQWQRALEITNDNTLKDDLRAKLADNNE